MKEKILMSDIYEQVASGLLRSGNVHPSHCDVRCAVNDTLHHYERDGYRVRHDYNQDRAFKAVRRLCHVFRSISANL